MEQCQSVQCETHHLISGGGGGGVVGILEKKWKKVVATKVRKQSLLKSWAKNKFVIEIDEKYVDRKTTKIVT